jgi:hypothetical protein
VYLLPAIIPVVLLKSIVVLLMSVEVNHMAGSMDVDCISAMNIYHLPVNANGVCRERLNSNQVPILQSGWNGNLLTGVGNDGDKRIQRK